MSDPGFRDRYGPWALIAGASEGVGAEFARTMAGRGLNVVLMARRQHVLDELAEDIRGSTGVEARALAVDLSRDDAMSQVLAATTDLEVGMLMYCAGADPVVEPFLDNPVDVALSMVHRNCVVPMQMCHHFAQPMVKRGAGGIILVSSGAGFRGAATMVAYGASKAFDMVMGEALWAELHDQGVDVLSLVLAGTDTPALRRVLAKRGMLDSPDDTTEIPGLGTPEEVVAEALANLSDGPTWLVGEQLRESYKASAGLSRSEAVKDMAEKMKASFMSTRQGQEAST